ncbi:hypothetical protein P8A21_41075 (plasmid) [Streptomyces poriferorum]|uniref:hypothetical protein n=1 Tax=Streptomyces poriferorum TaxID=2798799 RepID=UPI0027401020|nr:hypothetical protein [Streptomyces sp. Alt1]WLQ53906.1 hypothetical protein P8A21_41075 [Streptomyces sp. Alt1]
MTAAAAERQRVARVYTSARRHPWVLGKLGDWVIWFGPYTPAQLIVLGGGALLLIKGFAWWSWLGPVPVVLWLIAVWAVRGASIGGRSPLVAAWGWVALLVKHPAGRIAGRAARDRRGSHLTGAFVIESAQPIGRRPAGESLRVRVPEVRRGRRRKGAAPVPAVRAVPVSGLTRLLSQCGQPAGRS